MTQIVVQVEKYTDKHARVRRGMAHARINQGAPGAGVAGSEAGEGQG